MIDNLIDAIQDVVTDMQDNTVLSDSITATTTLMTFDYTTSNNIFVAGMYVEFPDQYPGVRYKLASYTKNSATTFTVTVSGDLTELHGWKSAPMRVFIKYKYDNYKAIQKQLIEEGKSATLKKNKYPLLALILPYEEDREKEPGIILESNARIILVVDRVKTWTTAESEEYSFNQNLRPLYELFMSKLKLSGLFQVDENILIQHKKEDYHFWSADDAQTQNKLAAIVDAIELSNLKLILNKQSNC